MQSTMHVYAVRPRKDKRGVDLLSGAQAFNRFTDRARIVFDCRTANDMAMMSSSCARFRMTSHTTGRAKGAAK